IFAALLLAVAPLAYSQTLSTGALVGVITDASGAVVPGATVTLKSLETNESRTAATNETGQYRFSLLKPGPYSISAQATGLKSNVSKVEVAVGQAQSLNLALSVQGTQEVIEVQADAPVVQTENANLTTSVTAAQVVNLPMN